MPGGPGGDLAAVEPGDLFRELVILLDVPEPVVTADDEDRGDGGAVGAGGQGW